MLKLRVATAVALLALLLPTLALDSIVPFGLFALALAVAATWEWGRLNGLSGRKAILYSAPLGVMAIMMLSTDALVGRPGLLWVWAVVAWAALLAIVLPQGPDAWRRLPAMGRLALGWLVMSSTWVSLTLARQAGVDFLLSVLCLIWVSDISAYFAGHRWGRRRLAPSLSPGKTWEGVGGACVGVLALAVVWMAIEPLWSPERGSVFSRALRDFGWLGLVVACAGLVALGVLGDLFESLLKRAAGVKDSSSLLPGHGGVLDRADALLPALPAAMAILALGGVR